MQYVRVDLNSATPISIVSGNISVLKSALVHLCHHYPLLQLIFSFNVLLLDVHSL